ncbi:hypothetical protein PENTCL1PPCAC_23819, partial [Pristionchus entomophagus]
NIGGKGTSIIRKLTIGFNHKISNYGFSFINWTDLINEEKVVLRFIARENALIFFRDSLSTIESLLKLDSLSLTLRESEPFLELISLIQMSNVIDRIGDRWGESLCQQGVPLHPLSSLQSDVVWTFQ